MKKFLVIAVSILVLAFASWYFFLKEPTFYATDGYLVNLNDKGVIIEGYDPAAYFTDNMPVKGTEQFKYNYHGATYWFTSAAHADLFKRNRKNIYHRAELFVVMQ